MRLMADFGVFGFTPVPWSAPTVTRRGTTFPNHKMVEWQNYVQATALKHRPEKICLNSIALDLTFLRAAHDGQQVGQIWGRPVVWNPALQKYTKRGDATPDLTNLLKAFEDGLRDVFWADDVQVSATSVRRLYGERDGVLCRIYEIEPSDFVRA